MQKIDFMLCVSLYIKKENWFLLLSFTMRKHIWMFQITKLCFWMHQDGTGEDQSSLTAIKDFKFF